MSGGGFRLASGGSIDRSRPLSFSFDGKPYAGYAGDTLASALLANGVRVFGRSFKYHRPRGVLSAGHEEPNALVELRAAQRREPNVKATTIELYNGLVASSQNCWPSLDFDVMALNGLMKPVFAAGFYYKTFMWPASFWEKVYEPIIRRAAGLGRASALEDPDSYERANAHCDVLIVGGGPAGLAAALAAGRSGAKVILCEDDPRLGGRLLMERESIDGEAGPRMGRRRCSRTGRHGERARRSPAQASSQHSTAAHFPRLSASPTICPSRRPSRRASNSGASSRAAASSRRARPSGRWRFRTMTGRGSCWPALRAPISIASASPSAARSPSTRRPTMVG